MIKPLIINILFFIIIYNFHSNLKIYLFLFYNLAINNIANVFDNLNLRSVLNYFLSKHDTKIINLVSLNEFEL